MDGTTGPATLVARSTGECRNGGLGNKSVHGQIDGGMIDSVAAPSAPVRIGSDSTAGGPRTLPRRHSLGDAPTADAVSPARHHFNARPGWAPTRTCAGKVWRRRTASIGLVRKSFMPAASACSRSRHERGRGQRDDRQLLGRRSACAARRAASWPLITGICTSISIASNGRPSATAALHRLERHPAVARLRDAGRPMLERRRRDHHVDRVVLDQQDARGAQPLAGRSPSVLSSAGARVAGRSGSSAQKRAAVPGALCMPTSPPIRRGQLAADRQAEAGAAVAPRRRVVALRERLEQARLRRARRCPCRCP